MVTKIAQQSAVSAILGGAATKTQAPSTSGKAHEAPSGNKTTSNDNIDGAVRTMQKLMMDLGSQLSQEVQAQTIIKNNPGTKLTAVEIQTMARNFSKTAAGGLGKSPIDGVWGKNTRDALLLINQLVQSLGVKDVRISEGTGPAPYKSNDDLELLAKQNIDNLSRLFTHAGTSTTVTEAKSNNVNELIVDMVDKNLPDGGVNNPFGHWGEHPLLVSDLANLTSFFEFISGLQPPFPCESLEDNAGVTNENLQKKWEAPIAPGQTNASLDNYLQKMAQAVLDGSIYRLGQDTQSVITPISTRSNNNPHCISVIEKIIEWFKERSEEIFDSVVNKAFKKNKSLPSPRPDRKGQVVTMIDAQLADYYKRQMNDISDQWKDVKKNIENIIKEKGNPKQPIVTSSILRDAISGAKGKAHTSDEKNERHNRTEGPSVDSSGRTIHRETEPPPFSNFIDTNDFSVPSIKRLKELSDSLPVLNLKDLRRGTWQSLVDQYVAGNNMPDKYRNFGVWAAALRDVIRDVFKEWNDGSQDTEMVKNQYKFFGQWLEAIRSIIATYNLEKESIIGREQGRR